MNRNLLIVLAGGFVIALLVAMIVSSGLEKEPVQTGESVEVLVASHKIPMGATLTAADLKWQSWPKPSLFDGAIVREGEQAATKALSGRVRRDIASGEPLTELSMVRAADGNLVVAALEPGKRAMALKVSAQSMVGGFINPGDHVDVILTHRVRVSGVTRDAVSDTIDRLATETVLENVRVLAIDQRATKAADEKAKVGRTVTLEVSAQDSEKLALAGEMGELSLTLRGVGDDQTGVRTGKIATTDVSVSPILQEIAKRKSETNPQANNTIRIYSDRGVESVKVRK
ncbi:MAG: Flp pilus assembly protein CpaB [Pseudobdellovibrionaceae bacterium]